MYIIESYAVLFIKFESIISSFVVFILYILPPIVALLFVKYVFLIVICDMCILDIYVSCVEYYTPSGV